MERRFLSIAASPIKLEARENKEPKITGYASVFYDGSDANQYWLYDDMVERIMPSAFDRAMKEDDVRGLFNHNPDYLLGRTTSQTLSLSVDKKGLRYDIDPPATSMGRDVLESIKRGDLTGSSFAFVPEAEMWREEGDIIIREIHSVRLYDVGPVTYPAYESSTTGLRSVGDPSEAKQAYEKWKRDQQKNDVSAKLASYRSRARAVMVREKIS